MKRFSRLLLFLFAVQLVVLENQACAPGQLKDSGTAASSSTSTFYPNGDTMDSTDSTEAVSKVVSSEEILPSFVSIAGTTEASATTYVNFGKYHGSFSEDGSADSVNAPMWMAVLNLSGDVCNDLINQEKGLAAGNRRVFKLVDFNKGADSVSDAAIADMVRHLARSAWSRNETSDELTLIKTEARQYTGTTRDTTIAMSLAVCSSIFASLDTNIR